MHLICTLNSFLQANFFPYKFIYSVSLPISSCCWWGEEDCRRQARVCSLDALQRQRRQQVTWGGCVSVTRAFSCQWHHWKSRHVDSVTVQSHGSAVTSLTGRHEPMRVCAYQSQADVWGVRPALLKLSDPRRLEGLPEPIQISVDVARRRQWKQVWKLQKSFF